jgi:uncharacterized membrane protein
VSDGEDEVGRWRRHWTESGRGYYVLLCALLVPFLIQPWWERRLPGGITVVGLMLTVVLLSALFTIARSKLLLGSGVVVVLLPSILDGLFPETRTTYAVAKALTAAFMAIAVVILLRDILRHRRVTFATICGALSVYLMLGFLWTEIYLLIDLLEPADTFTKLTLRGEELGATIEAKRPDYFYFSFVTLSTLGYGDISPLSPAARLVAVLEAIVGQLFLVVLVASLVSAYGRKLR